MKAINITKFNNFTIHYYASFWDTNVSVNIDNIRNGNITLDDDVFYNKEKESNFFAPIKSSSEKELITKAKKILIEYCGISADIFIVFYNGKYSESRSECMQSINIK